MSLIDLFIVGVRLLFAGFCAWFGLRWGGVGCAVGAVMGLVAPAAIARGLSALRRRATHNRPHLPTCRTHRCSASDYRILGDGEDGLTYRCACGDRYVLVSDRGASRRRFFWVDENDARVSYLSHRRFGPWESDSP